MTKPITPGELMEEDQRVHPAVVLRAAAEIARGIAHAATPGTWYGVEDDTIGGHCVRNRNSPPSQAPGGEIGSFVTRADACQIGLWNPVVALACARWLEACADNWPPQLIVTATPTASAERRVALETARELLKAAA